MKSASSQILFGRVPFAFFVLAFLFPLGVAAQQTVAQPPASANDPHSASSVADDSLPSAPQPQFARQDVPNVDDSQPVILGADTEKEIQKKEQSQRILGVMPRFGVTSRQNAPPLTTGQKFRLFAKSSFDPYQYFAAGFQAGLSQAQNEFPGYGRGAAGYGKRYGASLADQVSSNFFANFVYPSLVKEDPRYFRLGEGSFRHRMFHSLAEEFVCHTDKGGRSFNWSNVLGAFSSGGLSNTYYPRSDRGFGLTMSRSAISLLYGSAGGLVDEFWPDIQRKFLHRRPKEASLSTDVQPESAR